MARLQYDRTDLSVPSTGDTSAISIPNAYRPKKSIPHGITENIRVTLLSDSGNLQFDNYSTSSKIIRFAHQWDYSYA